MKAGLFITGNLSVSVEDPEYWGEPVTVHGCRNLVTTLNNPLYFLYNSLFLCIVQINYRYTTCEVWPRYWNYWHSIFSRSPKLLSLLSPG